MDVLVAGGGFIGGRLVANPLEQRLALRSVEMKPIREWSTCTEASRPSGRTSRRPE